MKTTVVFLADGFEECEGLLVVDLMRRANLNVITASVTGKLDIVSSHNVQLKADALAEDINYDEVDLVVLPGGIPGTYNLAANETVIAQCKAFAKDKLLAAICAAPSVLANLGLLEGKRATVAPSFEDKMAGAVLTHGSIAVDGNIITGQGLGATIPFALELVSQLTDKETSVALAKKICFFA